MQVSSSRIQLSFLCTTVFHLLKNDTLYLIYIDSIIKQLKQSASNRNGKNIMLIGAGEAGRSLALEFSNSQYVRDRVVCVIDDNPIKRNKRLYGIPIVGNRTDIPKAVEQYHVQKIIFAIPSCSARASG